MTRNKEGEKTHPISCDVHSEIASISEGFCLRI